MDDCSDDDMAALASAARPRPAMPVGQALPANREDWTLERLRGQPLPDAVAILYVLAFARRQTFYIDVAEDFADAIAVKYRIDRAQHRHSGKRGVTPLYCAEIVREWAVTHLARRRRHHGLHASPHRLVGH